MSLLINFALNVFIKLCVKQDETINEHELHVRKFLYKKSIELGMPLGRA